MTTEAIRQRINASIQRCMLRDEGGNYKAPVCIVCDRFIKPNDIQTITIPMLEKHADKLKPNQITNIPLDLIDCYKVQSTSPVITQCLLSPRSTYLNSGFTCCGTCKQALASQNLPRFCIANNFCFGDTPDCLLALTDIELAMITNIKTFGFCFTFTGGIQKELKGSLSYYSVKKESIVRSVAQLEGLNLNRNVVVLLYGTMTAAQNEKARKKRHIRIDYISRAIRWLLNHNCQWKHLRESYQEIVDSIKNPYFVDRSIVIGDPSDNADPREDSETFQVFYPDGQISTLSCGQQNVDDFRKIVGEASMEGFNIEYRCSQLTEAVAEYKDENLINACLLQFPYGRGAINERRIKNDGSITTSVDLKEYIQYLSMLSPRQFHRDLFSLILYNMYMKQMMVRKAAMKSRNEIDATLFAQDLKIEDIKDAIHAKRCGRQMPTPNNNRGHSLLGAIDVICQAVPHSNEAARKARRNVECLQHHFGCPTYFLTVTPDDDNHFLVQVYSDIIIDDDTNIASLSNAKLSDRSKQRTELRIKFPGICAYFFQLILDIIIKDVIGWDEKNETPLDGFTGLFGTPQAFSETTEEQGRKTLHGHFLIWTSELNSVRASLHSPVKTVRQIAAATLADKLNGIASCRCYFNEPNIHKSRIYHRLFPHECTVTQNRHRRNPKVVSDQQLRELRCKRKRDDSFVYCQHCNKTWNDIEMLNSYLTNIIKIPDFPGLPDLEIRKLKSLAIQYQKEPRHDAMIDHFVIDVAYNHHIHTDSCFKKQKTEKTVNKCKETDECRYRYPQRAKPSTVIQDACPKPISWFMWNGECIPRYIKEVSLQRHPYDAFQNNCCEIVSCSQISCNSNLSLCMPGPVAQYCVTYTTKGTQKDDTEAYEHVKQAGEKVLSTIRKHEDDNAEAIRRLLAMSFSHQISNVAGGSLASFCTRNESRFRLSHSIVWCPLRDIKTLLQKGKVSTLIKLNGNNTYFQCQALNYLCRPDDVETLSPFDFYSDYEIVKATSANDPDSTSENATCCPRFINTDEFHHPSFLASQNCFRQAIKKRDKSQLVKVTQYDFPDTASFASLLTDMYGDINESMEQYSLQVLLLFHSYRTNEDMQLENSFTKKLRHLIQTDQLHVKAPAFLQNIQDSKSNNYRVALTNDDLQRHTSPPYMGEDKPSHNADEQMETCTDNTNQVDIDELMATLELEHRGDDEECDRDGAILHHYSSQIIRNKGRLECGYKAMPEINTTQIDTREFVEYSTPDLMNDTQADAENLDEATYVPTRKEIVKVLIQNVSRSKQVLIHVQNNKSKKQSVLQPNGSARSIVNWSIKAKLDPEQRRAFEIITSSFVLSFFSDTSPHDGANHRKNLQINQLFLKHKKRLDFLSDRRKRDSNQLLMFLHGAAGSGKTAVINLVVKYCRAYCELISNDPTESSRSLIVTAMTGVAATLLNGVTLHSAVYLNQRKRINDQQVELWMKTKMLIIDEISFASKYELQKLHTRLMELKQNTDAYYGGVHIIFSGDMRQLEPVGLGKKPLYMDDVPHFRDWVNSYIELDGMYRFQHDPEWGALLRRFRNGKVTLDDIRKINRCVISPNMELPEDIKYATYFNLDRDSINCAIFEEKAKKYYTAHQHTNGFIMIFSDNLKIQGSDGAFKELSHKRVFWENCGESDINFGPRQTNRMDPVLKLYHGCHIMLPSNINVAEGLANGTQATVEKFLLKPDATTYVTWLDNETPVTSVFASDVDFVVAKHCNVATQPSLFQLKAKQHTFGAKFPKPASLQCNPDDKKQTTPMKAMQFPFICNHATTGHKLQGSGVAKLFVHNWSYKQNWVYVMLSRVTTSAGLLARVPLRTNLDEYKLPKPYVRMIRKFSKRAASTITYQQYKQICKKIT